MKIKFFGVKSANNLYVFWYHYKDVLWESRA